jgi:hypothetical protein
VYTIATYVNEVPIREAEKGVDALWLIVSPPRKERFFFPLWPRMPGSKRVEKRVVVVRMNLDNRMPL